MSASSDTMTAFLRAERDLIKVSDAIATVQDAVGITEDGESVADAIERIKASARRKAEAERDDAIMVAVNYLAMSSGQTRKAVLEMLFPEHAARLLKAI